MGPLPNTAHADKQTRVSRHGVAPRQLSHSVVSRGTSAVYDRGKQQLAMAQHFRAEFMQIPVVTRVYTTACVLTTLAVVSHASLGKL